MPFAKMWMDLETVIQSEVNQKEKNKCRILMRIYATSEKIDIDDLICKTEIETETQTLRTKLWAPSGEAGVE